MKSDRDGYIVWLTGLSGAGKSTVAKALEHALSNLGKSVFIIDGDIIRSGLCSDLSFSPQDRKENIRRVAEVAKLFAEAGVVCIVALISPYHHERQLARQKVSAGQFIEVYVNAPVNVCEQRDPKGLYAKARAGKIKDFTGISAPYEPPDQPEIELLTDKMNIDESIKRILSYLKCRLP